MSNARSNNSNQGKSDYQRSFSRPSEPPANELSDGICAFLISIFIIQAVICFMYAIGGFRSSGDDWDMIFATIAVLGGLGASIVVHTFLRKG